MNDMALLQSWIGRTEDTHDRIDAAHAARIAALFEQDPPDEGEPLAPLWHWCYFAPAAPQSQLGPDGHPRRGGFLPPITLPRRMWAGGRLTFHRPLCVGEPATRRTEILSLTNKSGRQGELIFLTLRHSYATAEGAAIEEEQDIVYRAASRTERPQPATSPPEPADWHDRFQPDPAVLFRYSAVSFNAHRIHYDLPYATAEEGYPALVVHGPLTATLLLSAWQRHTGRHPRRFTFRGLAPLFADAAATLCGQTDTIRAEGPGGYVAMSATVEAT